MIGRTDIGAEVQHRSYEIVDFEFRDDSNSSTGYRFEGIASVVDKPYTVRDQFGEFQETIRSGAFNKTLKDGKADVALFVNHDAKAPPLATRAAGTLELSAKPDLHVTADLDPERPDVQVVRSAVRRGEMRQMSIGFNVPKARDEWNEDYSERTISEVGLVEASIVWRGSNDMTTANMRSLATALREEVTDEEMWAEVEARGFEINRPDPAGPFIVTSAMIDLWAKRPGF